MAKILSTLTLTGQRTGDKIERGKIELGKGRSMRGIVLKVSVPIANASGGAVAMTDTQRQTMLGGLEATLSYGKGGRRKPYAGLPFTRLQQLARYLLGSEWEGYTDSSTGLAKSMPNGQTTTLVFYAVIPTGCFWQDKATRKLMGVGRTQAATMELEVKRQVDALPSGCTISGNVTADVIPDDYSSPYDRWLYLPEWHEVDETDKKVKLPAGLPLLVVERTQVHASSPLTDYSLRIDGEAVDERVSSALAVRSYLDVPNVPAEASILDRVTAVYVIGPDVDFRDLPTGAVQVEQHKKDLATFAAGALIGPIPSEDEVREDVAECAGKRCRNKTLRAVSLATILGYDIPKRLAPYVPFALLDGDDQEFERYPGLVSESGAPARVFVPDSVLANARQAVGQRDAHGETRASEDLVKQVALAVPGAVQDARGLSKRGSVIVDQVRGLIRG